MSAKILIVLYWSMHTVATLLCKKSQHPPKHFKHRFSALQTLGIKYCGYTTKQIINGYKIFLHQNIQDKMHRC